MRAITHRARAGDDRRLVAGARNAAACTHARNRHGEGRGAEWSTVVPIVCGSLPRPAAPEARRRCGREPGHLLERRTRMPESRLSVGNVEIVGLTDIEVEFPMPLTQLFPHVPLAAWDPHRQRYPEVFPRPDTWRPHFGGFLLRSQGRTILVDTGMGSTVTNPGAVAMFTGGADGHLLEELQAVGVRPDDIDTVFLTHLHPDHVGQTQHRWRTSQAEVEGLWLGRDLTGCEHISDR